jgi:hypothetical protein
MDPVKKLTRGFGLIGLEVADEMPGGIQIRQRRALGLSLLDAVLAEIAQPGVEGLPDKLWRDGFRDGHQLHVLRTPPRAKTRRSNPFPDPRDVAHNVHNPLPRRRAILPPPRILGRAPSPHAASLVTQEQRML